MSHQPHCPLNTFKPQGWVSAGDPPSCTCNEGFGQIGAPFNLTQQEKGCCEHWGENSNNQYVCLCSGNCHKSAEKCCYCHGSYPKKVNCVHRDDCPLSRPTTDTAERKTYPWCQDCKNGFAHSHTTDTSVQHFIGCKNNCYHRADFKGCVCPFHTNAEKPKLSAKEIEDVLGFEAPTTNTSDWRERFDVLFKPIEDVLNSLTQGHGTETFSIAKAFIEQTHLALLNELKEEVEEHLDVFWYADFWTEIQKHARLQGNEAFDQAMIINKKIADIADLISSRIAALSEKQKEV